MALAARLTLLGGSNSVAAAALGFARRLMSTEAPASTFTAKEVAFNLDNTSDPEAEAAVRAFQRAQFAAAAKAGGGAPAGSSKAEPELEFAAQVERKYLAAQIVETGIQGVAVPLAWDKGPDGGGVAALKRYVAQLHQVGAEAGFAPPAQELEHKVSAAAAGAETAKELLTRLKPFTSADYHAALSEALAAVEAETNAPVALDGASAGYKKFADKVKALAQQHKLPWQMLLPVKQKLPGADDDTADKLSKDYQAWLQSAALADAKAEVEELRAEAQRLLDAQLSKSAEAVRKEAAAAAAAAARKVEAAKGAAWAAAYKRDAAFTAWFDEAVAANPQAGPKASA